MEHHNSVFACHSVKDTPVIEISRLTGKSCEIFISNEMMGHAVPSSVVFLVHEDCLVHFKNHMLQAYEKFLREEKALKEK
jgi:hypothetical protein